MKEKQPPSPPHHLGPRGLLAFALWVGVLTGLGEVALYGVRRGLGRFTRLSTDVLWMAPAADMIWIGLAGGLLALIAWMRRRGVSVGLATFVYAFLASAAILLNGPIQWWAIVLLAAGVASQAVRIARRWPALTRPFDSWAVALASAPLLVLLLFAFKVGTDQLKERRALAALPHLEAEAPNVLLLILDTVRALSLSAYGYERPTTPNLERYAARGVLFERAYATSPWTLPTHASIFTGRWPHEMSADWKVALDDSHPTLAKILSSRGYTTGGFVANSFYAGYEHGLSRGFVTYEDYRPSPGQVLVSSSLGRLVGCFNRIGWGCRLRKPLGYFELPGRKTVEHVNAEFLAWIETLEDRPFFAFLNYFDAHAPYLPPEPFQSQFASPVERGNPMQLEDDAWEWTPAQAEAERSAYDGAIAWIDHHLGILLDSLQVLGMLENTLVIITSDHGEEFLEHGIMAHGNSLYAPSLHVPLILHFGGRLPAGVIVREPVTVRDIPATIIELLAIKMKEMPGASLARTWREQAADTGNLSTLLAEVTGVDWRKPEYPVSKGDMRSVVRGPYHLIENGDGTVELFDLERDPWERFDLAPGDTTGLIPSLRAALQGARQSGELRASPGTSR